ncbi:hypothetical protein [Polynucleobacter necessarius]|uniref:hypothetical protein n=1 Tax=Polynucleobacter necessarius TaxID=576610 RepID=UPI00155914CC|nr:hypothetical protein [Polynucleobacter necessarius]
MGYLVQHLLIVLLGGLLIANLPIISPAPALWSVLFAWTLLLGFAGPSLLGLIKVSPIRLIRKEFASFQTAKAWLVLMAFITCAALIGIAARDWRLALWTGLSFSGAIVLFASTAWVCLLLLSRWRTSNFAIIAQARQSGYAVMQITALGIALMALVIILLLRQDLLSTWQGSIPVDSPNRFMINVQGDQKQKILKTLEGGCWSINAYFLSHGSRPPYRH